MNYPVSKLLIYIPFHFRKDRLTLFKKVLYQQLALAQTIDVFIATNTRKEDELQEIYACAPSQNERYSFTVETFDNLKHPMSLRWTHKELFKNAYYSDKGYTHFLVVDADSYFFAHNLHYWMQHREKLKPYGLYPGFIRLEWSLKRNEWVCSEASESMGNSSI